MIPPKTSKPGNFESHVNRLTSPGPLSIRSHAGKALVGGDHVLDVDEGILFSQTATLRAETGAKT